MPKVVTIHACNNLTIYSSRAIHACFKVRYANDIVRPVDGTKPHYGYFSYCS